LSTHSVFRHLLHARSASWERDSLAGLETALLPGVRSSAPPETSTAETGSLK
jgi:hypothetical protein